MFDLPKYGEGMCLARLSDLLGVLGIDREQLQRRSVVVTGSNGKGSTAAFTANIGRAYGLRTGLFTSPHLVRYNERIRVYGAEAADADLIAAFEAIDAARGDITLTFFEYNLLAALCVFRQHRVDHAVLEVGLGGRLDATHAWDGGVAVVTNVGLDHQQYLGETIEAIAREALK